MPCPFCELDPARPLLAKAGAAFAIEDAYPVAPGHALVIPRKHVASLFDLDAATQREVWELVARVRADLGERLRPDGFTIGVNDGEAAGQTVPHAHAHVIPRRRADVPDPRGGIRWVIPAKAPYRS